MAKMQGSAEGQMSPFRLGQPTRKATGLAGMTQPQQMAGFPTAPRRWRRAADVYPCVSRAHSSSGASPQRGQHGQSTPGQRLRVGRRDAAAGRRLEPSHSIAHDRDKRVPRFRRPNRPGAAQDERHDRPGGVGLPSPGRGDCSIGPILRSMMRHRAWAAKLAAGATGDVLIDGTTANSAGRI